MESDPTLAAIEAVVRPLLADALGLDPGAVSAWAADTPLFGPVIGLSSLSGANLLAGIEREYGLDVADGDLDLDSLESIATLCAYVAVHLPR
ncbi:acyl carrier protein [Streptacidiphilus sp. PB12-B1b]|nr:acyl carrier protein [Streptacidiphilus sp. PB12-B1b]